MHLGPGFQVQGFRNRLAAEGTRSRTRARTRTFISAFSRRNRVGKKKITRSEPRKNQCFASSCQPARNSRNCLCVALLPPADHVSTFSRSSLGVDDAGSSFGFTARAFLALDVFVGIVNVNGWTPARLLRKADLFSKTLGLTGRKPCFVRTTPDQLPNWQP